jgi:hypothetical protein
MDMRERYRESCILLKYGFLNIGRYMGAELKRFAPFLSYRKIT